MIGLWNVQLYDCGVEVSNRRLCTRAQFFQLDIVGGQPQFSQIVALQRPGVSKQRANHAGQLQELGEADIVRRELPGA